MLPPELAELDVFATSHARRLGLSDADLRAAVKAQSLVRLKRGWYTGHSLPWPADRHRLLAGIEHAARPDTVPSHYSAAILLGLPVFRPDWATVHLMRTTHGAPQNRDGLVIHKQVASFDQPNVALAVAQTALLCPVSGLMAYDAALHSRLLGRDDFASVIGALEGWTGRANLAVVRRLGDGRRESALESRTALVYDRLVMKRSQEVVGLNTVFLDEITFTPRLLPTITSPPQSVKLMPRTRPYHSRIASPSRDLKNRPSTPSTFAIWPSPVKPLA